MLALIENRQPGGAVFGQRQHYCMSPSARLAQFVFVGLDVLCYLQLGLVLRLFIGLGQFVLLDQHINPSLINFGHPDRMLKGRVSLGGSRGLYCGAQSNTEQYRTTRLKVSAAWAFPP
ncbi:hypothetical protein [Pseudomonas fluorescens]|uniref:Uncharacterized protein n=1 Tax=Pseudomonas fluorescens TaxID=294 RepID=A0A5E7PZT0_PSEFL|nr:hypothetical protein [Pseudomonas fluorescens]VVP54899.1 hypothetical protein PS880_05615 [Pseudomonas fluorescens]